MSAEPGYPSDAQTVDTLLDTLAHPIRREVIYFFERVAQDEHTEFADLVRYLDERMESHTDDELRIELVHTHLPKLAHRGWLAYDDDTGPVRYEGHESAGRLLGTLHDIF